MDVIIRPATPKISESIYDGETCVVPMADVQHIEKLKLGINIITKHTRWDMDADVWANSIFLSKEHAKGFLRSWCEYRAELEGLA